MSALKWTLASPADEPTLLSLMEAFYHEENLPFEPSRALAALRELLATADLGQVLVLRDGSTAHGYLVLTFGFSLEFGGRFVLLDEVFLASELRGRGWGRAGLAQAEAWARMQGVCALRLELNRQNLPARAVYLKSGFTDDGRDLLTRRL